MKIINGHVAFPDADEFMVGEMSADGTYQETHLATALRFVTNFTVAIDGGAHVGLWSRLLAKRFRHVIAVEPSHDTFEALVWNLAHWKLANVEPRQLALWRDHGYVTMQLDAVQAERKNTGARYVMGTMGGGTSVVDATRETIDAWHLTECGFLKLDVEGAELAALEGARATLLRCQPIVLFEEKGLGVKHFGQRKDAVQSFLHDVGYVRVQRVGCDEIWRPKS